MKIDTKDYNEDYEVTINCAVLTITDNNGNRYEIREVDGREGLKIRLNDGTVNIQPSCDNVLFVSTNNKW